MPHDNHHHNGHHHHGDSCCSHHHDACCHEEQACDSHQHHDECCDHHEHDDFYAQLIEMADDAWMEVLKSKIKEHINATSGGHLEELAKIVSDANHARWKNKLGTRKEQNDFRGKVRGFFNQGEG